MPTAQILPLRCPWQKYICWFHLNFVDRPTNVLEKVEITRNCCDVFGPYSWGPMIRQSYLEFCTSRWRIPMSWIYLSSANCHFRSCLDWVTSSRLHWALQLESASNCRQNSPWKMLIKRRVLPGISSNHIPPVTCSKIKSELFLSVCLASLRCCSMRPWRSPPSMYSNLQLQPMKGRLEGRID